MQISFYFRNGQEFSFVSPKEILRPKHLSLPEGTKATFFTLEEGHTIEELKGQEIIIKAHSYCINKKVYELTECFGIKAILFGNKVFPILRSSKGRERDVFLKKKRISRFETITEGEPNNYWPIIGAVK